MLSSHQWLWSILSGFLGISLAVVGADLTWSDIKLKLSESSLDSHVEITHDHREIPPDPAPSPEHSPDTTPSASSDTSSLEPSESSDPSESSQGSSQLDIPPTLEKIRGCESGHSYHGQDGDLSGRPPRSTASGAYRFLDSTWEWVWRDMLGAPPPTERAKDASPADQDRAALALYDEGRGAHHWNASRGCWG